MERNDIVDVQPTLPSKNKIVPDLSERDCTFKSLKKHWSFNLF
jgi:hypothetical protein